MSRPDGLAPPAIGQWMPLTDCSDGAGYLSVYLSEPLARYPIRHVSKPADNKSDPNIETGTYGLFSTCERTMRGKLVREGRRWIFFLTKHAGKERRLAGYYEIGWYAEGAGGAALGDYALAATSMRFIEPLALEALPELARDRCLPPFRTVRPIEGPVVQLLRKVIDDQPDCTSAYLRELRRIEQFTRYYSGYAYPSWGQVEGFSWELAAHYLRKAPGANPHPAVPASGRWRCSACERIVRSKAFLKSCPVCGALLTLTPISEIG